MCNKENMVLCRSRSVIIADNVCSLRNKEELESKGSMLSLVGVKLCRLFFVGGLLIWLRFCAVFKRWPVGLRDEASKRCPSDAMQCPTYGKFLWIQICPFLLTTRRWTSGLDLPHEFDGSVN